MESLYKNNFYLPRVCYCFGSRLFNAPNVIALIRSIPSQRLESFSWFASANFFEKITYVVISVFCFFLSLIKRLFIFFIIVFLLLLLFLSLLHYLDKSGGVLKKDLSEEEIRRQAKSKITIDDFKSIFNGKEPSSHDLLKAMFSKSPN